MVGRLHAHGRLFLRRRSDDPALAALDAASMRGRGGAVRIHGLRVCERFGNTGLLMIGLLGAINIRFYEQMARRIHCWQYSGCRMLSYTPWYTTVANLVLLWCSHCWREPFGVIRGASPLLAAALAEHRFLFATLPN